MSLTTPVLNDYDSVFPGENWFFYWKTSASLWKTKLASIQGTGQVFVPMNWAFHSESGESFDFADQKPETDLVKLCNEAKEVGKEVVHLEDIYKKFNFYILKFLGSKFLDYRESELKEVSRVMTDEAVQRAAQLIVSYHYYFIKEAQTKFDRTYVPDKNINLESEGDYIH